VSKPQLFFYIYICSFFYISLAVTWWYGVRGPTICEVLP